MPNTTTIILNDFNLEATLDSGQVFGYRKKAPHTYVGEIGGVAYEFEQKGKKLVIRSAARGAAARTQVYFDLSRDLSPVYEILEADPVLRPALELRGLRLIRQDSWEALAGFILSSNNNVKRIQHIWRNLTDYYSSGGERRFPAPGQIARSHERTLRQLGLGYRAPFLQRSAAFIASNPPSLDAIREAPYDEAHARVLAFPGIGPKVADCVLLYGFQRFESFPVDVWILRSMRKLYFKNRSVAPARVLAFARKRWANHAGYVQQYLFHASRTRLIL